MASGFPQLYPFFCSKHFTGDDGGDRRKATECEPGFEIQREF